jgi:hypothetical protein
MNETRASGDRAEYARLVAATARRPQGVAAIRAELERQALYQPEPSSEGLDELATLLARRFSGPEPLRDGALRELEQAYADQSLVHLYAFALRREAGEDAEARCSLDELLALDPDDPMALYFDAYLRSQQVVSASEEVRLGNIAKFAATPLLSNPYSLAVGVLFEAIRDRESARVLDVGIGSGAQMERLLMLVGRLPHRLRRLEIVGLDFVAEFLAAAGERIAAAADALTGRVEISYEPVQGRVETLDASVTSALGVPRIDAANATIALHEVAGEAKLAALWNLRRLAPRRLVLAEWNYCLENVLAPTCTEYVFNVRAVAAAMVAALRPHHSVAESRAVVRDWLSQGDGQLTCASSRRQECFLDVTTWKALLDRCDFDVLPSQAGWLTHASESGHAAIGEGGWYVRTADYGGAAPIALMVATPR